MPHPIGTLRNGVLRRMPFDSGHGKDGRIFLPRPNTSRVHSKGPTRSLTHLCGPQARITTETRCMRARFMRQAKDLAKLFKKTHRNDYVRHWRAFRSLLGPLYIDILVLVPTP